LLVLAAAALLGVPTYAVLSGPRTTGPTGAGRAAQPVTDFAAAERGPAPKVIGNDLSGRPVDLAVLRGAPVVLNVWGSWCAPCRTEAPVLRAASAAYAGKGVRFVGINVKDNVAAATAFERRFEIPYPSLDDQQGRVTLALADYLPASIVPATLVLDHDGRVAARVLGAVEESTLRSLLDTVLAEP
jgi:thiol-disulfide isomerase/thioredoxin